MPAALHLIAHTAGRLPGTTTQASGQATGLGGAGKFIAETRCIDVNQSRAMGVFLMRPGESGAPGLN